MSQVFSLPLLAPLVLLAVAAAFVRRPGQRPGALLRWSEGAALSALALAAGGVRKSVV